MYKMKEGKEAELDELRRSLKIDKHKLDDEIEHQAVLYHTVAEMLVDAISRRDELKEELQRTDATLADELRKKLTDKDERWSETRIGDLVLDQLKHKVALGTYSDAVKKVGHLQALRESFDQKGKMLRELSALFVAGYWDMSSTNTARRETTAALAVAGKEGMKAARRKSPMYRPTRER